MNVPIPEGFAVLEDFPLYCINMDGVIYKVAKASSYDHNTLPKLIRPFINKYGYPEVVLSHADGSRKHKSIHRLVAETFIDNPDNKGYVNHIDGDKLNSNVSNLEWVTASENELHSYTVLGKKPTNLGASLPSGRDYRGKIRAVQCFTKDLEPLKIYFNPTEAETDGFSLKQISAVCCGRQHTHKGFIWKYI